MDKYYIFRKLLDFVASFSKVVDADMNCYRGCMEIVSEADGKQLAIEITITDKKDKEDKTDGS